LKATHLAELEFYQKQIEAEGMLLPENGEWMLFRIYSAYHLSIMSNKLWLHGYWARGSVALLAAVSILIYM
jgi:hypothetical protein